MGMYLGGQKISPIIKVGEINNQDKTITENGTYTADAGYTGLGEVTVNVPSEQPVITELNITPTTSAQTIVAPSGTDGYSPVKVTAVTSSIDSNIVAGNIKKNVSILGVTGNVVELNGETKVITPTTSQQVITPSSGKNAITQATVNAVTSSIDSNIIAENIKKDVSILGVTGTYEGSGGGGGSATGFLVQVIDYDGTVLKSERLGEGDTFTLPSQPSHTGLTFQSWSSPVTITNNTVTVTNSDITIGATYTTTSGLSEFDITLTTVTGLSVTLNMNDIKDWGDGTSDTNTTHTYTSAGDYTITCNGSTGSITTNRNNYYIRDVRFGSSVTSIGDRAFHYCYSLTSITIPSSVTSIGPYAFSSCSSLTSITIPSSVTSIDDSTFYDCSSLTSITIPSSVTSIGPYAFQDCYSLTNITIPSSVTSIGPYAFSSCSSLTNITIPSSVTSIGPYAFQGCRSILEYDFSKHTTIPTLSNTNAFESINRICKIKVPALLESQWKSATNWLTYADYIVGV